MSNLPRLKILSKHEDQGSEYGLSVLLGKSPRNTHKAAPKKTRRSKRKVGVTTVRGVRKASYLSRRVFTKAANFSGRVEQKADRIIHGTDPVITLKDKILFEEIYYKNNAYTTPIHPALPRANRKPAITLLIPSLQKSSFFGGTATALIFSAKLASAQGKDLRVVETIKHGKSTASDLTTFLKGNQISLPSTRIFLIDLSPRTYKNYGYIDMHPEDIFVASAWWDAYLISKLPLQNKFVYLIQDFEPIFYSNSDYSVLAESTYHSEKFLPVCNTELMYKFMSHRGYKHIIERGLWFEPAVGVGHRVGHSPKKQPDEKKRLFLYGRPSVERNLFYLGLSVLNELFGTYQLDSSEWEVFMAGQDGIANILLEGGIEVQNLGKMSFDEYYDFAKTVDVALSLMLAPHPSYPPLELSSIGAAVVTTQYETKQSLEQYSKNIMCVPADPKKLEQAVLQAAALPYETRLKNAKASSLHADWNKSLDAIIRKVSV